MQVLVRSDGKYILKESSIMFNKKSLYNDIYETAISFFLKNNNIENIDIKIIHKKIKGRELAQFVMPMEKNINKHTIYLDSESTLNITLEYLFHELVHLKQYHKKEFYYDSEKNALMWKDDYSISYNKYRRLSYDNYIKVPWETEAKKLQKKWIGDFKKSKEFNNLREISDLMRFTIDNI